jgi:hypothetical protein
MGEALEGEYMAHEEEEEMEHEDDMDLSSENLLNYTQMVRKRLINSITARGMPIDKDERMQLMQALRDMDQTSVNRLRLDVENKSADNNRAAQEIISQLYQVNPYGLRARPGEERDSYPEPEVKDLPDMEFDEGEKHIGLVTESSNDFIKRMESEED